MQICDTVEGTCPPIPTSMPLSNVRSAFYCDLPFDKIFKLFLSKSAMIDNFTISFAVISATNFLTFRIIGILHTSFYNFHGIKAVRNLRGDASFVHSAPKPPKTRVLLFSIYSTPL